MNRLLTGVRLLGATSFVCGTLGTIAVVTNVAKFHGPSQSHTRDMAEGFYIGALYGPYLLITSPYWVLCRPANTSVQVDGLKIKFEPVE